MRGTSISRSSVVRIDDLGRVAIPKDILRELRIREGDKLQLELKDEEIVLTKYTEEEFRIESVC